MENEKQILIKVRGVILHEGKMLVVVHPHDTSYAALPGGHLEWGEDPKECATREIFEELGIKATIGRLLYINTYTQTDGKHYIELFFEVLEVEKFLNIENLERSHANEIAKIIWANSTDNIKIMPKSFWEDFKAGKILGDQVRFIKD